jgi:hypothetical protein
MYQSKVSDSLEWRKGEKSATFLFIMIVVSIVMWGCYMLTEKTIDPPPNYPSNPINSFELN